MAVMATCAWFGHVTDDASQTLQVMRLKVKVMTQKRDPSGTK